MKLAVALLGALLVAVVHGVPTAEQVRSAIHRASELNTLKRRLNAMETRETGAAASGCPLNKFHGERTSSDTAVETRAIDLLDARRVLLDQGFSVEDLEHETVRSEFARQVVSCPSVASCDRTATWRTADGSCNNLNNPTWGMKGQPQLRLINKNAYQDQVQSPRTRGVGGGDLPNPRSISNRVHRGNTRAAEVRSRTLTLHAFQMGQFIDHDIILTPTTGATDCCANTADSATCFPLRVVGGNDPQFTDGYCMNFARSSPSACASSTNGAADVRQQLNEITAYIDASNVYGSTQEQQDELRNGAFLRTADNGRRLPVNPDNNACRSDPENNIFCSLAGDKRVDTNPTLSTYHTLFLREHNRIARALSSSIRDTETLFQTTRRIIIGIMQKITYDEFLPSFLSEAAMSKYRLASTETFAYNATLDATIDNGFGIAYRIGHTWIPREMSVFTRNLRPLIQLRTEDTYGNPALTYTQPPPAPGLEGLSWWMTAENSPETDRVIEEAARSLLFKTVNADGSIDAFDLAALNIQRGRDHGLPSYNEFRLWCGLTSAAATWANNGGLVDHNADAVERLQAVYTASPQDIDLFTGVVTERTIGQGFLGPTGECIIGEQFSRLKFGDRFWYQGRANGLTPAQQNAIRAYSMSKLQCNNYNFGTIHAPNAFLRSNLTPCQNIADLDTSAFIPPTTTTTTTTTTAATPRPRPPPGNNNGGGNTGGGRRPRPRQRTIDDLVQELLKDLDELENQDD